jgi:hypothetical protein
LSRACGDKSRGTRMKAGGYADDDGCGGDAGARLGRHHGGLATQRN